MLIQEPVFLGKIMVTCEQLLKVTPDLLITESLVDIHLHNL